MASLRHLLTERLCREELRTLCFDLGFDICRSTRQLSFSTMATLPDYQLEYLGAALRADHPGGWSHWHAAVRAAYAGWQLERTGQLIQLAKGTPLGRPQQGEVRYLEGLYQLRRGDWIAARRLLDQALSILREVGDEHGALLALNALGIVLRRNGAAPAEIIAQYEQALALATAVGDEPAQAEVLNGLGLTLYNAGAFDQAQTLLEQARDIGQRLSLPLVEAAAVHNLGSIAWTKGNLSAAEAYFAVALTLEQQLGDRHGQAESLNSIGLIQEARSDWQTAAHTYEQSLVLMQADGDLYGQAQVLLNLGNVYWLLGDAARSLAYAQEAQALAADFDDDRLEGQAWSSVGDAYRVLGQYAAAEAAFRHALARKQAAGEVRSLKHTYLSLGVLYHVQRQADAARSSYQQALDAARSQQDVRMEATVLVALGQLALAQEHLELAESLLSEAETIALREAFWDRLTEVAQLQGSLELARPEPRFQQLLSAYAMACIYAIRVNEATFDALLSDLRELWAAQVEDGYRETACQFCAGMIAVWRHTGYADDKPAVIAFFEQLRRDFACEAL